MSGLKRFRLKSKRSEASSLLAIESAELLDQLDAAAACWTCHDEGDLDAMVSLIVLRGDEWTITPVALQSEASRLTDAEALARLDDTIFVFGSNFSGKSGMFDDRRAFVVRFSERHAGTRSARADVLEVGTAFAELALSALKDVDLLACELAAPLLNIEGAGFVGNDLVLGLRWPVAADGQPVLVRLIGAAEVLLDVDWNVEKVRKLTATTVVVEVGGSPKRPAGIRGMTIVGDEIHLVTGQTERGLAAKRVKAAAALHVRVDGALDGPRVQSVELQTFEGFRKVEGLATIADGRWLYSLDDEDAVVLVVGDTDG